MHCKMVQAALVAALFFACAGPVSAWGRGGGASFRAGGVAVGGARGGAVAVGSRGGVAGGYRGGAVAVGSRDAAVGGYRGVAVGGYRGGAVAVGGSHVAVATDFGFGHVAGAAGARGYVAAGHYTTPYSRSVLTARGVAVRRGFYQYGAFNSAWWRTHPAAWRPAGWNAAYVWAPATWPALATWFGWSGPPVSYDFGTTIVYQGDQVYLDGQPGPSAADYSQQSADLALSAPAVPPAETPDEKWQPLGVFSLVQGEQSDTSAVFELAVNKAGVIRGNYYNVFTDTTLPVRGAVDGKTQRASWIVGDQKTTVYDAGIDNLTKEESPVLIHFGKERTQQWLLVRVQEQDAQVPPVAKDVETPPPPSGDGIAQLTVIVPADAEVFIDGTAMTQTGTERNFDSPPLEKGVNYSYAIRARWTKDGKAVEQTRKVPVRAGAKVRVDFTNPLP